MVFGNEGLFQSFQGVTYRFGVRFFWTLKGVFSVVVCSFRGVSISGRRAVFVGRKR